MEQVFNKLVRDNIPNIIENKGGIPVIRVLGDTEYRLELLKKLSEECGEVAAATTSIDILQELADVLEVIKALAKFENKSLDNIIALAAQRESTRGAFEKRIFLERVIKPDGEVKWKK